MGCGKDGGQFDSFTGATITPRAVVNALAKTLAYVETHPEIVGGENEARHSLARGLGPKSRADSTTGLCAPSGINTVDSTIGLGFATLFVLVISNASISLIRHLVDEAIRLPALFS